MKTKYTKAQQNAIQGLKKMAQEWPRPGELEYYIEEDHVWLHKIRLPQYLRGGEGTKKMALFLSYTDTLGLPVCLTADPVDEDLDHLIEDLDAPRQAALPDNPRTYDLVKWYRRFGFQALGYSEDGFLMERPAVSQPYQNILNHYQASKRNDWSFEEFAQKFQPVESRDLSSTTLEPRKMKT